MRLAPRVMHACLSCFLVGCPVVAASAQDRAAPALDGVIEDGTLVVRSSDGGYEFALDGRLQADAALYSGDAGRFGNGTAIRRARLGFEAVVHRAWEAAFDVDVAGNDVEIKDAWIGYGGFPRTLIRAGQLKEPFSLQTLTSSKDIMFMERASIDELAPGRSIGLAASRWGSRWQATAGAFGEDAGARDDGADEAFALTGRFTTAPVLSSRTVVHAGVSASHRVPRAGDDATGRTVRVQVGAESGVAGDPLLDTDDITFVGHANHYNGELAVVVGSLTLQGEYTHVALHRSGDRPDVALRGTYASASLFLTGDRRDYLVEDGEFDRVRPRRAGGAWEVLARYSDVDLSDTGVGRATHYTAGVTWHININVRWMLNYSSARTRDVAPGAAEASFNVLQTRVALAF